MTLWQLRLMEDATGSGASVSSQTCVADRSRRGTLKIITSRLTRIAGSPRRTLAHRRQQLLLAQQRQLLVTAGRKKTGALESGVPERNLHHALVSRSMDLLDRDAKDLPARGAPGLVLLEQPGVVSRDFCVKNVQQRKITQRGAAWAFRPLRHARTSAPCHLRRARARSSYSGQLRIAQRWCRPCIQITLNCRVCESRDLAVHHLDDARSCWRVKLVHRGGGVDAVQKSGSLVVRVVRRSCTS